MHLRKTFLIKLLLLAAACFQASYAQKKQPKRQPNVVFFLVDDLGWTDIEPFGSSFYETPNLNRLAEEGMKFTDAYVASPVCSPSRASIMTGKYPVSTQTTDWFGAPQPQDVERNPGLRVRFPLLPAPHQPYLSLEEVTIAEALKQAGYKTFLAGKWHLGEDEKYWPEHQGFEVNKGGYYSGRPNLNKSLGLNGYFSPYGNPRLKDGPEGEYLPMRLAEETNKFIEANKDQPFFAYFSLYSVHTPLQASAELIEKYKKKKERMGLIDEFSREAKQSVRMSQSDIVYAAMVEAMDQAIGKVLDKLEALGLEDNTIVIFFSDNGGLSTAEGSPTSNLPLRAGKGWMYEGGIRVPLLIKWPGIAKPGSFSSTPVIGNDFYPTLLQAAKLPLMRKQHTGGRSILPLLKGGEIERRSLFWHYPHYGNQGGSPASAIRKGEWKLIHWYVGDRYELFNLKNDLSEKTNIINEFPTKAEALKLELERWLKREKAFYPTNNH